MSSTITRITVDVPDISCGHCEQTIREEIGQMRGVATVNPSAVTKQVEIDYDPGEVTLEEIRERFKEIEYPVAE